MKTAAEAFAAVLVDELARAGVTRACLSPGSRSGPLALAFAADPRFEVHVVLDERSACFLALGMAKASGDPVAVLSTSGTAAANLLPAVLEAHHSRTPLVVLTADRPPELRDTGAPQTIDQVRLFGSATRLFVDLEVPEHRPEAVPYWRSVAARACIAARGSPPGPVHLNVPLREPLLSSPVSDERLPPDSPDGGPTEQSGAAWTSASSHHGAIDATQLDALANRLERARRVVLLAGPGAYDPEPVARLAEVAGWPLLAEPASNARRGAAAISSYEALLRHRGFAAQHQPDLVLRMGSSGLSRTVNRWLQRSVPQILLDSDAAWLDPGRTVHELVRVDPAATCHELARVVTKSDTTWLDSWLAGDRQVGAAIDEVLDAGESASEPRTARDLSAALPSGSTLVVASSMPVRDLDWFMRSRTGLRVIANRGVNGIDGFVSTVLGVAAVHRSAVALVGDLATLHDQNAFLNARHRELNVVFVLLNNEGGGIFSFLPQSRREHFETLFATPQAVSFRALADLYGIRHRLVESAAELVPVVEDAAASAGVDIVEVRTDRRANVELHERIWARTHRRLDDALG